MATEDELVVMLRFVSRAGRTVGSTLMPTNAVSVLATTAHIHLRKEDVLSVLLIIRVNSEVPGKLMFIAIEGMVFIVKGIHLVLVAFDLDLPHVNHHFNFTSLADRCDFSLNPILAGISARISKVEVFMFF